MQRNFLNSFNKLQRNGTNLISKMMRYKWTYIQAKKETKDHVCFLKGNPKLNSENNNSIKVQMKDGFKCSGSSVTALVIQSWRIIKRESLLFIMEFDINPKLLIIRAFKLLSDQRHFQDSLVFISNFCLQNLALKNDKHKLKQN